MSRSRAYNLALEFERVVASSPTAVALICEGASIDFQTLNALANRRSRWLESLGVGQGDVVCLELPKAIDAYALAMACLKLGAPYVFLDPAAPVERSNAMIGRAKPTIIVSVRNGIGRRVVFGDEAARHALTATIEGFQASNLADSGRITGTDPAYIMFTSGSTGEPKGVVIPHQGVLNLVAWAADKLGIGPSDRLTNVNPLFFDNSVFDIYAGLLNGAAIVALDASNGHPPADLLTVIARNQCTFFFAVPTLFMFLDSLRLLNPERLPTITRFMFGGEGFPLARLRRFFDTFKERALLINCYGPTETSCICSGYRITEATFDTEEDLAPLGLLNAGFSYRILDQDMRAVPAGATGELWLGGPCIGLGYVNNAEETAKKFRQDPLVESYRSTFYRTGDFVKVETRTGELHFRGRADNQVKLRGYRVELEEIDHALASVPGVTRALAVVLQEEGGISRLVAGYSGSKVEDEALLARCRERLPAYMVPGRFTWLDTLPTNANGKADRRGLAALLGPATAPRRAIS